MNDILHGLNRAQRDAVTSEAAVLQVLAPPGSGKTKTLTARVAYFLAHHNLKPWNIIVCTFTVKAANEMKERIRTFVGGDRAKQLKLGTFHSIALRYLKQYGQHIGLDDDFGIADTSDSKAIVKRVIKKNGFTIDPGHARSRISAQKAKGTDSELFSKSAKKVEQQEFARVYSEYEATLKASNLLDYDDLLLRCCLLIRTHPHCVSNVEAVLIDEFQDTNHVQYDLMNLFAQKRAVITIVGDPDQSIYGFRSAEIKNLALMKQKWPDTLTINLEENYRSSGAILHAAQNIIEQDENRPPKKLQATHSHGLRPVLRKLPSAYAEADWLVAEVKRIQALTGNLLQPNDFAVLLRSASLSRLIESALGRAGVPYRMVGGTRFYDRVEVKLIVDYLRVVHQTSNSEAVERIINVPPRRLGEATIKGLQEEAQTKGISLWTLILGVVRGSSVATTKLTESSHRGLASFVGIILSCQNRLTSADMEQLSLAEIISMILKKLNFQQYLKQKHAEDHETRWANMEELLAQAADMSDPEKLSSMLEDEALPEIEGLERRPPRTTDDILSMFLANIALASSSEEKANKDGELNKQLTISTIHAAKGLEWPVIFIPACFDGSIPHSRANDHDEERRLLYVGMTRAQAMLYLSCPIKNTQREDTAMSTFLVHPGVNAFFEEHGPSISTSNVPGLATTLRRECPSLFDLEEAKKSVDRDEDNFWPLNGESPHEESTQRDVSSTSASTQAFGAFKPASIVNSAIITMQHREAFSMAPATLKSGFTSVSSRYEELMEQSALQKVDKRCDEDTTNGKDKPIGRKRQIEGQGTISSFLKKPAIFPPMAEESSKRKFVVQALTESVAAPSLVANPNLQEVPLTSALWNAVPTPACQASMLKHKLRTAPLTGRPSGFGFSQEPCTEGGYVFLSSSPTKPESAEKETLHNVEINPNIDEDGSEAHSRPVSTYHTTSMQKAATQRRTLGMRRSLTGWSSRGGKR